MTLENVIINDVLCFLTTSRNSLTADEAVISAVAFYTATDIISAKEKIFAIFKEKPVTRRACVQHPNPSVADVQDILTLLTKKEGGKIEIPKFVAKGHNSLPPSSGFLAFARAFNRL